MIFCIVLLDANIFQFAGSETYLVVAGLSLFLFYTFKQRPSSTKEQPIRPKNIENIPLLSTWDNTKDRKPISATNRKQAEQSKLIARIYGVPFPNCSV